jgi:hypothetical protein
MLSASRRNACPTAKNRSAVRLLSLILEFGLRACLRDFARDGNCRPPEYMRDLRVPQPRSVVLERQVVLAFIESNPAQAVGVGKLAETPQLVLGERGLQFIRDFHECHAPHYTSPSKRFVCSGL